MKTGAHECVYIYNIPQHTYSAPQRWSSKVMFYLLSFDTKRQIKNLTVEICQLARSPSPFAYCMNCSYIYFLF